MKCRWYRWDWYIQSYMSKGIIKPLGLYWFLHSQRKGRLQYVKQERKLMYNLAWKCPNRHIMRDLCNTWIQLENSTHQFGHAIILRDSISKFCNILINCSSYALQNQKKVQNSFANKVVWNRPGTNTMQLTDERKRSKSEYIKK